MQELTIESFPLNGTRLIEASAGTGKTYTISGLYLRLLLDLERDLSVTKILVVTFTEAATQELRGRIRQRLYDALRWLEGKTDEDDMSALLQAYKGNSEVIQKLRDSITCMDEAAIFTIHGFCQRTLTDSAFESGALFDSEFVTDETFLRQQIARDFWRKYVVESDLKFATWVSKQWKSPGELLSDVDMLIKNPGAEVEPRCGADEIQALEEKKQALFIELKLTWVRDRDEVCSLLNEAPNLSRSAANYKPVNLESLYDAMDGYVSAGNGSAEIPEGFELFTRSKLNHAKSLIKKKIAPDHPFFDQADSFHKSAASQGTGKLAAFALSAAHYIGNEIEKRKEKNGILFFDDLLRKLEQALMGDGGDVLANKIHSRYPVGMIDEFQDTDPLQYRIFNKIYAACGECGLFMIGDPKQAIYSFRGADIFTYMKARHDADAESGHFTLGKNWRSHSSLVNGVNAIFERASAPFIYHQDIEFYPVTAAGKADKEPLTINGEPATPLVSWFVEKDEDNEYRGTITKGWANTHIAAGFASEVAHLLNLGQRGEARIGDRGVAAHDIAILVRDRFEAAHVRQALNAKGVASVYISRDSVFDTEEARDLSHLLRAVAEPANSTLLRTALATRLVGMTAAEIHSLNSDEIAWERKVLSFQEYHRVWNRQGFMAMFHQLLRQQGVIARLLSLTDGERRMTNLLQLAELAQVASLTHPGTDNLLRWIADERLSSNSSEEQQLRMESDEDLVQIITIHKSKGLEYSIVFLPFIWGSKGVRDDLVVSYHDESPQRVLHADIRSAERDTAMQLAEKERLAEDLRLLYVALTRAKYRCYFSWGQFNGASASALAYLLHQSEEDETGEISCSMGSLDDEVIREQLAAINSDGANLLSIESLPDHGESFIAGDTGAESLEALRFSGNANQSWRVTSFTGLTMGSDHGREYRVEMPEHDLELSEPESGTVAIAVTQLDKSEKALSPFSFPRGAKAGLFLHQLFENIDFPGASGEVLSAVVQRTIEQYGFEQQWLATVVEWVGQILDTPLNEESNLSLRAISSKKRLVELEFHFPLHTFSAHKLNRLLAQSRGDRRARPTLDFNTINGMMKGFVDLIFEHDGRFYLLDYKSNYLGDKFTHYQCEQLTQAIDGHYYDLQYLIYTLALHRYLKSRVTDYDYERDLGGVYYLFLRGMRVDNGNRTGVFYDRPQLELVEALDALFSGSEREGEGENV